MIDQGTHDDAAAIPLMREIVTCFAGLFKAAQLYDRVNEGMQGAVDRFLEASRQLVGEAGSLEISARDGALYVDGPRLRPGSVGSTSYQFLVDVFRSSDLLTLRVDTDATRDEIDQLIRLWRESLDQERDCQSLAHELAVHGVGAVELVPMCDQDTPPEDMAPGQMARRVYLHSIGVVKAIFHESHDRNKISARRVKRVVQEMMDSLDRDAALLVSLASIKNYDEYTFNHSVNVSVLAIALARHIGMSRRQLYLTGQAGILHDLGKMCIAPDLLNKPGALTRSERVELQGHPIDGFMTVLSQQGVNRDVARLSMGAYEHHTNVDGSGYPSRASERGPSLIGRILGIVDRFDAMTSARVYRDRPIPPEKALSILFHSRRTHHDEAILRAFLNLMGLYPLGSVVRLSDGMLALVVRGQEDPELRQYPVVKLILEEDGSPGSRTDLDLSTTLKEREPIQIVEAVDAQEWGIEVMDYLL